VEKDLVYHVGGEVGTSEIYNRSPAQSVGHAAHYSIVVVYIKAALQISKEIHAFCNPNPLDTKGCTSVMNTQFRRNETP